MQAGYGDRTSAQRLWLAGAAALVGLLLIGGGWLVWQGLTGPAVPLREPASAVGSHDPGVAVAWGAPELADLCEHADMATGSFYRYFDTKRDVFVAVVRRINDDLRAAMRRAAEQVGAVSARWSGRPSGHSST